MSTYRRRGFTLVELLVVIAIIGILMALLFPAVNGVLESARRTSAANDASQIANAVIMYETEYGRLPSTSNPPPAEDTTINVSRDFVRILTGENTGPGFNPRRIVFLEAPEARQNRGGTNTSDYVDPWGAPYQIALNYSYDNELEGVGKEGSTATIRRRVAVWNDPSQHEDNPNAQRQNRRYVASWD